MKHHQSLVQTLAIETRCTSLVNDSPMILFLASQANRILHMGSDISANYEDIIPIFIVGFWKVHRARHKNTNEPVSLWILDENMISLKINSKAEKDKFASYAIYALQQMRKLHHPSILKINEVNENPQALAFSAEPVVSCLINEKTLTPDEIEYISLQVAQVMSFLHKNAKMAHFNLNLNSICLTSSLGIKLCGFYHVCPITGDAQKCFPNFGTWTNSLILPDINFSAPELVTNKGATPACDVFSFAAIISSCLVKRQLFSFSSPSEMTRVLSGGITLSSQYTSEETASLLKQCLSYDASRRPSFDDILCSTSFNSMNIRIFKYLEVILTKNSADKFSFLKSLIQCIGLFSQRILRNKFFPILMDETKNDFRFGPVTIPLIFHIASNFDRREFQNEVVSHLSNLFITTNPAEIILALFSVMPIFLDRVDKEKHYDIIYPTFQAALQSNDSRLQMAAVSNIPLILKSISPTPLRSNVVPRLLDVLSTSNDPEIVANVIDCLSKSRNVIGNETFIEIAFLPITYTFNRIRSSLLAGPLIDLIESMNVNTQIKMTYIVPLASQLLALEDVAVGYQIRLITLIQQSLIKIAKDRNLADSQPQHHPQEHQPAKQPSPVQDPPPPPKKRISDTTPRYQPKAHKFAKKVETQEKEENVVVPPKEEVVIKKDVVIPLKKDIKNSASQEIVHKEHDSFWSDDYSDGSVDEEAVDKAVLEGILKSNKRSQVVRPKRTDQRTRFTNT